MFGAGLLLVWLSEKLMVSTGWQSPCSLKENAGKLSVVRADPAQWAELKTIALNQGLVDLSLCAKSSCSLFLSSLELGMIFTFLKHWSAAGAGSWGRKCTREYMGLGKPKIFTVCSFQKNVCQFLS